MSKRHRHTWVTVDEPCFNCEHYIEHCAEENAKEDRDYCGAVRYCDPSGKCDVEELIS